MNEKLKPIRWIGSALRDLRTFPVQVKQNIGFALDQAQRGGRSPDVKTLKGIGDGGVLEIVEDHRGDTYRGVYTVRYQGVVYVLHAFQKRSKKGISTPKQEIDLIRRRLKGAEEDYRQWQVQARARD